MGLIVGISVGCALLFLIIFALFIVHKKRKRTVSFIAEPYRRSSERELTGIIPIVDTSYNPETTTADHERMQRMQTIWLQNGGGFKPIDPAVIEVDNIYAPENM